MGAERDDGRIFRSGLLLILCVGLVLRIWYLLAQPGTDPTFAHPMIDGAYYLEWARSLVAGTGGGTGAYYLAPLYPSLLAVFLRLFGENYFLLYLGQHLLTLATAGLLALISRHGAGSFAGLATAGLAVLYHPFLFFAGAPLGESVALFLLILGLWISLKDDLPTAAPVAGALSGLAALARPNLLLIPLFWALGAFLGGRRRYTALLIAGLAVAILPVTVRNWAVSGHLVPISSNSGITAFHGNGPGARGVYQMPAGFSGALERQRDEAGRLARRHSGLELDDVEADHWWGRQALKTRLADPWGSLKLAGIKTALLLDNYEHGLDYSPALDSNPWRPVIRFGSTFQVAVVPFALLLGLSAAGLFRSGLAGSGGRNLWLALAGCVLTPLLFYMSSRYRLPLSVFLTVPAGCGLAALFDRVDGKCLRSKAGALICMVLVVILSCAIPSSGIRDVARATGLSNRAIAYLETGRSDQAIRDALVAEEINPRSAQIKFNLGVVLEARGELSESEQAYRGAIALDPTFLDPVGNLAALLVTAGRPAEAIPVLRSALARHKGNVILWTNLVIAHAEIGDLSEARKAIADAGERGIQLNSGLVSAVSDAIQQSEETEEN